MNTLTYTALAILIVFAIVIVLFAFQLFNIWLHAILCKAHIPFMDIVAMRFRKTNLSVIIFNTIRLKKAGIQTVSVSDLESHDLAGGDVSAVVSTAIAIHMVDLPLNWKAITYYDLAGQDPLRMVNDAIQSEDYTGLEPFIDLSDNEIESSQSAF
ncbi:MAG: flotillin-like FloA family protein [Phycisphaerales bacterium]